MRVTGFQFGWTFDPAVVRANVPVEFEITTPDVNHSFALYDDRDVLLLQVQMVPGKTQTAVHTFGEPGVYRVRCLEFCGFGHELMTNTLEVRTS